MAESTTTTTTTWMSILTDQRGINFSEEASLTIRRKMRAVSFLAGIPILCLLKNFQYSNAQQRSSSSTDSSTRDGGDDEDPTRTTVELWEGECVKKEDEYSFHEDEQMECVICLNKVCKGEKFRVLEGCNHGFHVDCIDAWLMQNSSCPLCRCSVTYIPTGQNQQRRRREDQEAYYETLIATFLSFLDHFWTWFLNPLGFDQSCQDYHAYL